MENYTEKCQEVLNISDPFDRLDLLRGNFAEGFFNSTDKIAEMLMDGPLGELANASVVRIIMDEGKVSKFRSQGPDHAANQSPNL